MSKPREFGNTKIICTIGPASTEVDVLTQMIEAGMDVVRLNFSHGTHEDHLHIIEHVRQAARRTGENITLLQDLSGPKIRTGLLQSKTVVLKEGASLTFTIDDVHGTEDLVSTTYERLPHDVQPGDTILLDDGKMKVKVVSKSEREVHCVVVNGGVLAEKKGMNLPGVRTTVPSFTEKDVEDLKFGLAQGIDYVALSFVRTSDDVRQLREVIIREGQRGVRVPIIAKIEKPEAVDNIDAIIGESDVIMVARGDLGVELAPEDVPPIQKMIVRKCNEAGKPVIIATQMLESMIENPRPTRAEASDVANAVLDGADAVMLSGETSVGKHPVEAVQMMDKIIRRAETQRSTQFSFANYSVGSAQSIFDAVAQAACVMAWQIKAKAIVPLTHSGSTAAKISKYRPLARIIAITGRERILRRLNLIWGVRGIVMPDFEDRPADVAFKMIKDKLVQEGYVQSGDYVVFTAGIPLMSKGTTNTVKVEKVE
jgi:pyruvate kinase